MVSQYEDVVESREKFGDDETTLKACARVGLCYVRCGRIARGIGMIEAIRAKSIILNLEQTMIFCHLMLMLSFFEIRQFDEGKQHVEKILSYPEETVGHYILAPAMICKAYLLWMKNQGDAAFDQLKRYMKPVQYIGWYHQNAAWNFDFLDALESNGHFLADFNYDAEVERILEEWDDIYMKGVAFRYRAQRLIRRGEDYDGALSDLRESESYLKEAGAVLELARTWISMGNLLMKRGDPQGANSYLERAWSLFSRVDARLFPKDLMAAIPKEQKVEYMIGRMININESLNTVRDMQAFLKKVVHIAMDFTMAMRGAFFGLDSEGNKVILASRNLDPLMLKSDQFQYIEFIVGQAAKAGQEIVLPGSGGGDAASEQSLARAGIDSLICMPVTLAGETQGFLYLDNRFGKKAFSASRLPYVRLVASQSAVGLVNIKKYDEMKARKNRFEDETLFYKREMGVNTPARMIVGESDGIQRVLKGIEQVAPTDTAVLVMGETGVGKELVAKAIHSMSHRKDGPFIPVNLAALPSELVASELFGHEKGAFTGAGRKNKGRFELADGGTIFLDEIGDLQPAIQVKLLRVLQENTFERLGSAKPINSNFRVIAATNKDLYAEVEKGNFRQDLFYRLNVFPLHIPPLRARKGDIHLLAVHFMKQFGRRVGKHIKEIPAGEIEKLTEYRWPGNVRELKHLVERAVILYDGSDLSFSGFSSAPADTSTENAPLLPLADYEKEYIERVFKSVGWKLSGPDSASAILKVKPTTLLYRMKKLGIEKPRGALVKKDIQ